ncbi:MAG: uroporphyrinogen-III synthase [Caldilineaceae bacterium]|nr:uroporphyrinogen-III synthase [Caldilineaceae bacterium]
MTAKMLSDLTIAITRAVHQAEKQRTLLEAQGARIVHYPCIAIAPPRDPAPLDAALQQAANGEFSWLIVTSTNTVEALAARLQQLDLAASKLAHLNVAAVGSASAQAIRTRLGLDVTVVPEQFTAANLADAMPAMAGMHILLPQSTLAAPTLREQLQAAGAQVTQVNAYRNVIASGGDPLPVLLWEGKVDAITFTSESTVRFFNRRLQHEQGTLAMLHHVAIACIGPVTAQAATDLGMDVTIMPDEHTLEGLTTALVEYFNDRT